MKLAFSTLGCPDWDLTTAVRRGIEYGYDGIDIRTVSGTNEIVLLPEFSTDLARSVSLIERSGLELTCFSSSVKAFPGSEHIDDHRNELTEYLKLCRAFDVRQIRIFGGDIGLTARESAMAIAVENCKRYADLAAASGVLLLFETHDSWTSSNHVKQLVEAVNSEYFRVVWDVAHPYRFSGETPAETWKKLGSWIVNTHWKDSFLASSVGSDSEDYKLCLLGKGDLPLSDCSRVLEAAEYGGYYTLEWEKLWHPYLEEPEVALPQYIQFMKTLAGE